MVQPQVTHQVGQPHLQHGHTVEMVGEKKLMETAEVKSLLQFCVLEKAEDDDPVTL